MVPMRRLIDSHTHIEGFESVSLLREECMGSGVDGVICVGGDIESSKTALSVAESFPGFYFPAIGVHPSNILKTDINEAVSYMADNIERCVALGEVGLDYAYDFAKPKDVRARMRDYLEALLELASDYMKPVSVHSRSAYRDTLDLVADAGVEGVFHWFDGPIHTLKRVLDAGYYVSAAPSVEYSGGARDVLLEAPLERILVETDSPVYLRSFDRTSSPVDVVRVVEALAELKGYEFSEVARVTTRNAESLFKL